MKRYIFLAVLISTILIWYLNDTVVRMNQSYNLSLSLVETKKIVWKEEWNMTGDGYVVGVFQISQDDYKRLSKGCQSTVPFFNEQKPYLDANYKCSILDKEKVGEVCTLALLENGIKKYLFYKLDLF